MTFIKPLNKKYTKIKSSVLYADFETVVYNHKHYITCYSLFFLDKNISITNYIELSNSKEINSSNLEILSDNLITNFIDACLKFKKNEMYIYFHNLGKFDGLFILNNYCKSQKGEIKIITRDNTFYEITININGHRLIFRDSYLIFPTSLKKMGEVFDEKKFEFEHQNISIENYFDKEFLLKIYNYCENDAKILGYCFNKFRTLINEEFSLDIVNYLTLSSLAFSIYRHNYLNNYHIEISRGRKDAFIRQSYHGGVADVYKPYLENGYYYDVNSLYPYIMSISDMPVGDPVYGNIKLDKHFDIHNFFGFIKVKVKCPKNLYIPFLTVNDDELGLISPIGQWEGIYFSEEIKYALSLGYEFEYYEYYKFDREVIFKEYVHDMYNKRLSFKDKPALSIVYKLLLNSLYGRFGMNPSIYNNIFIKNTQEDTKLLEYIALIYDYTTVSDFSDNIKLIRYNAVPCPNRLVELRKLDKINDYLLTKLMDDADRKANKLNISVQIASAITAYSRIYMHKIKLKYQENLYYSDTDSIVVNKEIDDNLISAEIIGLFKLEHKLKRGIFIAPKLYYMETEGNSIIKCKGINSELLNYNDFKKLYENECIQISSTRSFLRNLTNYSINTKNVDISINGMLKKRHKIYKQNIWVDTHPIKI